MNNHLIYAIDEKKEMLFSEELDSDCLQADAVGKSQLKIAINGAMSIG